MHWVTPWGWGRFSLFCADACGGTSCRAPRGGCRVTLHTPAQGSADSCCGLRHIPAQIPWWFLPLLVAHIHLGEMNTPGTRRGQRTTRSPCHTWRCQRATCLSQHFLRLFLFIFLPHWDEMKAFPVLCMEAALCCNPVLTAELE